MKIRTIVCTIIAMACFTSSAFAAPQKVNFQGKLTDAAGNPITASVSMVFSMYDVAINGTALWTETQSVAVTNGIYNVLLGQINPIDTELTETKALWLGVKVGADAEMSPRVVLTAGIYDVILMSLLTMENGVVTIGNRGDNSGMVFQAANGKSASIGVQDDNDQGFMISTNGTTRLSVNQNGNVGIGIGIASYKLEVAGTLRVSGSDLAEPFDMTDIASLELGDVVVIDPLNPLHVTKSTTAYDTTVAGIVSSTTQAGYVAGSRSDGSSDKPIALVGRVVCNVSTENGAIKIGDLLTTSNTPGYAMKATDFEKRQGAVLGKALQAFDGEQGQILVLVTLQ